MRASESGKGDRSGHWNRRCAGSDVYVLESGSPVKRGLRIALLAAAALALLELLSLAAGFLLLGAGFVTRARSERAQILGGDPAKPRQQMDFTVPETIEYYAIHPYLGFVADPTSPRSPVRDSGGSFRATNLGFFRRTPLVATEHRPEPIRVGVFGGSAAFLFSLGVGDRLENLLEADDVGASREVVVESYAIPGYKQPQQLFALEYLLLMGERLDLVVNLDGFNEVALPLTENLSQGTAAIFPRSWGHLVGMAPSPGALSSAAHLELLRQLRTGAAAVLSSPGLNRSSTSALLWHVIDGALAPRVAESEARMASSLVTAGYAARGPDTRDADHDALLADLVAIWKRSSLMMKQICAANHIAYVHALQPNQYVPDSKPLGDAERTVAYRPDKSYRSAVEKGYPLLVAAGEELKAAGVTFVDLTRAFADVAEQVYVDDCCHFNRRGNAILAEKLAPSLARALAEPGSRAAPAEMHTR